MSEPLQNARKYECEKEKEIASMERPAFHLSPRVGWLNDPNGFSFYQGKFHLFYQYNPFDTHWGPMHWGHAVSSDLLRWEYLPAAIAPDASYDSNGCFSGSAVELPDGRHLLLYTGVQRVQNSNRSVDEYQTQCVAIGDGVDYEKYAGNPVLDACDLPEGSNISDFRDPKIWKDSDDTYWCVAANRAADGSGQVLLFSSRDALHWQFKSVLLKNENRFGEMWECPDLFELDGKWVLLLSAMDMFPQGMKYTCGNEALCLMGALDGEHGTFTVEMDQPIDGGIDFYAPQTMRMPDGRRVMIGWMQNPHISAHSPSHGKWMGQMSLPRELYWKEGHLCQRPIHELELLRTNRVEYRNVLVNGPLTLDGIKGRAVDLELTIQPASSEQYRSLSIHFAQNEKFRTSLIFDPLNSTMTIDRTFSGTRRAFLDGTAIIDIVKYDITVPVTERTQSTHTS